MGPEDNCGQLNYVALIYHTEQSCVEGTTNNITVTKYEVELTYYVVTEPKCSVPLRQKSPFDTVSAPFTLITC